MGISYHTVDTFIRSIFNKLNISSRKELGQYMLM